MIKGFTTADGVTHLVPKSTPLTVESRAVHDPFMGVDVQISDRLVDRLRGKYACGPHLPNGNPEFGWKQFQAPPIQHEAADRIERLEHEQRETLRAVLHHFGPEGAKLVTDHVLANQK